MKNINYEYLVGLYCNVSDKTTWSQNFQTFFLETLKLFMRLLWLFIHGKVQRDFRPQVFFHNSNLPVPLTNGLKYFRFWLRIHRVIRILSPKIWLPGLSYPSKAVSRGMIPRRVNPCGESISTGYHTPASQFFYTKFWITRWNLNQNWKYLIPLISGPGWFEWWKKLAVKNLIGLSL